MNLLDSLNGIISNLERGSYPNEQSITQGIVLRILSCLGWNTYDPEQVWPEYFVSSLRVDLALCHPPKKPIVFIEVKQPGKIDDSADKQLFEYAYHQGVPTAVLTDGQTWSFYLPSGQGSYEDRRFYKLDLLERKLEESSEKLIRYLQKERLVNGQALEDAQNDYKSRNRRNQAKVAIPEAWKEIIDSEEPKLIDLLSEAVEKKCGIKPDKNDVTDFLNTLRFGSTAPKESQPQQRQGTGNLPTTTGTPQADMLRGSYFIYKGKTYPYRSAKDVVINILKKFSEERPNFYELFYKHPDNTGRSRCYIGRTPQELYTDRPDLESNNYVTSATTSWTEKCATTSWTPLLFDN